MKYHYRIIEYKPTARGGSGVSSTLMAGRFEEASVKRRARPPHPLRLRRATIPKGEGIYGRNRTLRSAADEEEAPSAKKIAAQGETSPTIKKADIGGEILFFNAAETEVGRALVGGLEDIGADADGAGGGLEASAFGLDVFEGAVGCCDPFADVSEHVSQVRGI